MQPGSPPSMIVVHRGVAGVVFTSQLWKPKKTAAAIRLAPDPEKPKTIFSPKPLSADPSEYTQFRTYSTLYG